EQRVMLLPDAITQLTTAGHDVYVQTDAASGIGITDEWYKRAGAEIISDSRILYELSDLVLKLKAPSPEEFSLMRRGSTLFGMFHSEQNPSHIYYAGRQGIVVVEMESIRNNKNERLIDQTDITGEAGVYYALRHSRKMPYDMKAVVLGYGNVSTGAITACSRLGMDVKIIRRDEFTYLHEHLKDADILINGISWPAENREAKQYLVTREDIRNSAPEMIVLDLAVDFPNPIETIHPTTYANPYYLEEDRVHISIYGYPGLVPITSSKVYSKQVMPLALLIANNDGLAGIEERGDIGTYIAKAIIDPVKKEWRKLQPEGISDRSLIE
ncbi:hypothetical protein HZA99_02160, partial [Candidatus Woesearchaeota archaeon]|nr:hypothetical protein [Candidatus Woesearchaeota archaeon]